MPMEQSEFDAFGIKINSEQMDNGEHRFRMIGRDGSSYIRTHSPTIGQVAWQHAHHHKGVRETYIVQKGWMALAQEIDDTWLVNIYFPGEIVTTVPGVNHNVYMPLGSVIHTVKHGLAIGNSEQGGADKYSAPIEFDAWSKKLSVADIAREAGISEDRLHLE
jgi:mannose-6-phosphate isomerase-like protein (cupin superfamily)